MRHGLNKRRRKSSGSINLFTIPSHRQRIEAAEKQNSAQRAQAKRKNYQEELLFPPLSR